jgi:hypothetical protein
VITSPTQTANSAAGRIIFITGMHRSGTSFLARALNLAGLHIPEPDSSRDDWNKKGQWETTSLIRASLGLFGGVDRWFDPAIIDEGPEVLSAMAVGLSRYGREHEVWGWKDPRLMITLPYWLRVMPQNWQAELVISLRNPVQVASSLKARNRFEPAHGARICDRYMSRALTCLDQGLKVHLFNFNAPDLVAELTRLCGRLGLTPQPQAWKEWFSDNLMSQRDNQLPRMLSYNRLMALWREQAGASAPKPLEISPLKPKLRLAVLLAGDDGQLNDPAWLAPCLSQLKANTSAYCDYKAFIWLPGPPGPDLADYLNHEAAWLECFGPDHPAFKAWSRESKTSAPPSPGHKLQFLYEAAEQQYELDMILTLHPDAWPVRPNWDLGLLSALDGPVRLVGIKTALPGPGSWVDAAFLVIRDRTLKELGLRFDTPQDPGMGPLAHFTRLVDQAHGPRSILGLERSNAISHHPHWAGVYGGTVYHHNLCAAPAPQDQTVEPESFWQGSRLLAELSGRVFQEPQAFFEQLLYGEAAPRLAKFRYLLKHEDTNKNRELIHQLARESLAGDPLQAIYLCGLLSRVYAYHTGFLELYASACGGLGLRLDQAAYEGIIRYLRSHPLGKQVATG